MKERTPHHLSYVLLCLVVWHSALFAQTAPTENEMKLAAVQVDEADLIHPGDLIDVDVIGSLEYDWRGTLNAEGFLEQANKNDAQKQFKGIDFVENPVYGLCRSETSVAEEIAKVYSKNLRDPKVIVRILDRSNRPVALIGGAVKTPQKLQIKRLVFLNELIIVSGGLTENASGEVQIYRPPSLNCRRKIAETGAAEKTDGEKTEKTENSAGQSSESDFINIKLTDLLAGKKASNPQILSGDIITVQEAAPIYVMGGVANPKQISARTQITLSRAIDSAGGLIKNADAKSIVIYRRENGETKIIEADLDQIKAEKTPDVDLKAFDIVEVAQNGRGRSKFPPVIDAAEINAKNALNFPLRIIE